MQQQEWLLRLKPDISTKCIFFQLLIEFKTKPLYHANSPQPANSVRLLNVLRKAGVLQPATSVTSTAVAPILASCGYAAWISRLTVTWPATGWRDGPRPRRAIRLALRPARMVSS